MNILLPLLPTGRQLLQLIFIVFKAFGFTPFALDSYTLELAPSSSGDAWWLLMPALQLLCYIFLHSFVIVNRKEIFYTGVQVLSMNDILKYGSQMFAVLLVLVSIVLQRGVHRSVWVQLNFIRAMPMERFTNPFLRLYLWKFYGFVVFCAAIDCHAMFCLLEDTEDTIYYLVVLALRVFLRLRHLFHIFFIDLLKVHLQQLHYGLTEVTRYIGELQSTPKGSPLYRTVHRRSIDRLLHLKNVYGQLWDINDGINCAFGWSQICNFTANFIDLSCDLYWCYMVTVSFGLEDTKVYYLTLAPGAFLIVLLLNAAESCLREGSAIGTALLNIPVDNDPTLRKIVYRFGLQLSQQRIHLTAHGLFSINYSLLKMFGTGITTYMVIFITFSNGIERESIQDALE